jgi:hypothetical protein
MKNASGEPKSGGEEMSLNETVIQGTLQPDGTLVLDERPNLSPGRVTVVLRQEPQAKRCQQLGDDFFQMMEGIWAAQKARGFVPRNADEVETERRKLREESDEEAEAAIRLQEESRRLRRRAEVHEESP